MALRLPSMSPLRRGRIITTAGVLLLCFDTPTFRLLQFRVSKDSPQFGLADTPWRGAAYAATSLAFVLRECGGSFAAVVASLRAIGWRLGVAGALLLAGSGTAFPVAVALTTAANVLIILAMSPLITALMGRAMGHKLPLHTWGACVVGAVSVGLVFAGSAKAGPDQTRGCLLALTATFCFSSVMVLGSHLGAVSLIPVFPVAGVLMVAISLAALGRNATLATPTNGADAGLLILNGLINGIANVLMIIGSQTCPAAEVALIALLETALSPVLVYLVTLSMATQETPDKLSIIAGALIVATLGVHTLYDARVEAKKSRAARDAEAETTPSQHGDIGAAAANGDGVAGASVQMGATAQRPAALLSLGV